MTKKLKYKTVSLWKMPGRTLSLVFNTDRGWEKTKCKTQVPPTEKLTNYDLAFGNRTFLVLDPYGNERLSSELEAALFGGIPYESKGWTLAIDRQSGDIYRMGYGKEGEKFVAVFWEYETGTEGKARVPSSYLSRLDELKSRKRPFCISLTDWASIGFAEREYGYRDLRSNTVISLEFQGTNVEIWGDSYREVTRWKSTEEAS